MPIYVYEYDDGDKEQFEEYQSIHSDALTSFNGRPCHRVPALTHTDMKEFHRPIEMHSIGMHDPQEIADFRRQNPDIEVSTDPRSDLYGVPIARTRRDKLRALATAGFEER